jgi:hypothetical protein
MTERLQGHWGDEGDQQRHHSVLTTPPVNGPVVVIEHAQADLQERKFRIRV